ncbi:DUF72 domain-containing protein [Hyphomicrobium methylovorum]|uniref:DUF72 domain-containing protein n=1 Tax=Hyphomicrobium methylovorum TaxID=84 RepID=UPI0015E64A6B|nr:DUF72 domain-containing protein [Hyphomicrobium methylovorum]MBA2125228.1 DUF72 domain-containing protein [Hyphomicrobium methylovorum]
MGRAPSQKPRAIKARPGKSGIIRAGIGGWTFEPWRGVFYPDGLAHAKELQYASRQLPVIEVNGTYYGSQKLATFANWREETPDDFIFTVKGPRYATNRRELSGAGESIQRFFDSGVTELGAKLGPLLWQFAPTKKFDEADFGSFLDLLPETFNGVRLRHALEVRNPSFCTPEFIALARRKSAAVVFADHATYPAIADVTSDFVYLRLQTGDDTVPTAYKPKALDQWAERAKIWAKGGQPDDLPAADKDTQAKSEPRDTFVFFIHEGKVRAPNAAMAFMKRITAD